MTIDFTIVIPAFNEFHRLADGFARLEPTIRQFDQHSFEVIVVDDGSTDGTLQQAHRVYGHLPETLFIQQPVNLGKGAALRLGFAVARGKNVIALDADMAIDPHHLPAFLSALESTDIAPGSRALNGHITYDSRLRSGAGRVFNRIVRHYTHTTLLDTQCGAKGFQTGTARLLANLGLVEGFAYDAELLYLAEKIGLRVTPVPVTWKDVRGSTVRLGPDSRQMLRDMRALVKTQYVNPVVELPRDIEIAPIAEAAVKARVQGLVLARGEHNALVVMARDGALGGLGIAATLKGELRTATLDEYRGRSFEAI